MAETNFPNAMPRPWTVGFSESLIDEDRIVWVIDCEQGSVAEVQCPSDQSEDTALLIVEAVNSFEQFDALRKTAAAMLRALDRADYGVDVYALVPNLKIHAEGLRAALGTPGVKP